MFDLQIDRKKKKKKMSSMNKSCEKTTTTAHIKNILHVVVLYNIKRKKYKTFVQNWHSPSHLRQNGHDFV